MTENPTPPSQHEPKKTKLGRLLTLLGILATISGVTGKDIAKTIPQSAYLSFLTIALVILTTILLYNSRKLQNKIHQLENDTTTQDQLRNAIRRLESIISRQNLELKSLRTQSKRYNKAQHKRKLLPYPVTKDVALQEILIQFLHISTQCRDSINRLFYGTYKHNEEGRVLTSVCGSIERIFREIIKEPCCVTIKLIDKDEKYAETYCRSSQTAERDPGAWIEKKFILKQGKNTALDIALLSSGQGKSHFHANDLTKLTSYENERRDYANFYRCCLVVPIEGEIYNPGSGAIDDIKKIGLLCIDTPACGAINNQEHLTILTALARQLYCYMLVFRAPLDDKTESE